MNIKSEILKIWEFAGWIKPEIKPFLPGLAVILLIDVLGALISVATAIASKNMVDYAIDEKLEMAGIAGAIFAGFIILNMLMVVLESLLALRISESFSNVLRQRFFKRLLESEWLPLSEYHSGDLITRLTSDVSNITNCIINSIPSILALGVQLVASFLTLLYFEPKLAILAFILGPFTVVLSRLWGRKLKHLQVKVQESESSYRSYMQEAIQNFIIIKSFRMERHNHDSLQSLHENRMKWIIERNRITLAANNVMSLGYWIGYFLAFGWGAVRLSQKAISFGTMTAFLQLVQQVQTPFLGLARTVPQIITMIASAGRLMELEKIPKEKTVERLPILTEVGMNFCKVSFKYTDGEPVLDKISTEILPGQLVALIGPSGEGKTTLVRLLLALLRPSEGKVYFTDTSDGRYEASAATREWVTYVPQGNTLFSGTIRDNIRSGRTDATLAEIENAARSACAWSFIEGLPQGLHTVIGEHGLGLSEGQAQRIAIARAFLKKAPVMILDEATSALDMETEMDVLMAIKNLGYHCTCLVITHRLTALRICSRVLRIHDGKVMEEKGMINSIMRNELNSNLIY
ncbi:ABC-type multidrug transport system, ATPase and permease component [Desulfosporosinus orientis DSM 765]|uniref:ABC-type multidrug transport system, ATPase and permease component n=1 Tax=Desulfosporosinus orientis (strain ATCC 19365 / DSM 765 / NCIMB 8382 / VKM B-1628 / Singapore I) TaxID=768706 RepID=G7WJQ1_DESOD|nr:ABC transporter ATP-binding protein [Desulfosporosinus orientis]AET70488.1 ABC-type multidrug transport system, ATPase and permease component [Desulfosporosinus orientis DSM 765]